MYTQLHCRQYVGLKCQNKQNIKPEFAQLADCLNVWFLFRWLFITMTTAWSQQSFCRTTEWTPSLNGLSEHSTYSPPPPNLYFLKRTNMSCQLVLTYSLDNAFGIIIRNQSNTICLLENQRMCLIMQIIWSKHLVRALSISCIANTTSYWTLWNVSFECKKVCLK